MFRIASLILFLIVIALGVGISIAPPLNIELQFLLTLSHYRTPLLTHIAIAFTTLGSSLVLTPLTLLVFFIALIRKKWRTSLYIALASVVSCLLTPLAKSIVMRPRPTIVPKLVSVSDLSFPSGHSLGAMVIYLMIATILWPHLRTRTMKTVLLITTGTIIGLIGLSRPYLGVHYPSDVLAGFCLGAAWIFLLKSFFNFQK